MDTPIEALASYDDAMREYAENVGMDHPERAWILTGFDVWMPNPHYHSPSVPHPEDDTDYRGQGFDSCYSDGESE